MMIFLTIVLAIITGWYTWLTYGLSKSSQQAADASNASVEEMRKQHEALQRPYISIYVVHYNNGILSLRIENLGRTAANNVALKSMKPFERQIERKGNTFGDISNHPLFQRKIPTFPPGMRYELSLDFEWTIHQEHRASTEIVIEAMYSWDGHDETETETTEFDLRTFLGVSIRPYEPLHDMSKQLQTIASNNTKLTNTLTRLLPSPTADELSEKLRLYLKDLAEDGGENDDQNNA